METAEEDNTDNTMAAESNMETAEEDNSDNTAAAE